MPLSLLFAAALAFLLLLAGLAFYSDRHRDALATWLDHPLTYSLALGVYYTGWSYFGTGAAMWESGLSYLSTEMGWSFAFLFGWPLLLTAIRFMKTHRVTTLPGALAIRYGSSGLLTGLVAAILVLALLPYIALQFQAIAFAFHTLSPRPSPQSVEFMVVSWAVIVALFGIVFGARQPDPTLRHPGLVAAVAVSAVVKLLAVGVIAVVAFWRFPHLFATAGPGAWPDMSPGSTPSNSYLSWVINFISSLAGVLLLPHVFHLALVESGNERQVHVAKWAFPLYGWLFESGWIPIAVAGALMGLRGPQLQASILLIPTTPILQILALIGGVAAATGMAVVTIIALANLLLIDVLLPVWPGGPSRVGPLLLPLRWGVMLALALASYGLWHVMEHRILFRLGLPAFIAVAQLVPAFFLGLVWPRLQLKAVVWGLALSLVTWLYTAFLPGFARSSPQIAQLVAHGPWGLAWLRPRALFGMEALPPFEHAFFWCTLVNLGVLLLITIRHPLTPEQELETRERLAGVTTTRSVHPLLKPVPLSALEEVLAPYLGPDRARAEADQIRQEDAAIDGPPELRNLRVRDRLERLLRGPLGPVSAKRVIDPLFPVAEEPTVDVMEAYRKLEQLLELRQEDLADRLRELSVINQAAERLVALEDPRSQLEAIVDLLVRSFQLDLVGAYLLQDHRLHRSAARGFRTSDEWRSLEPGSALEAALHQHRPLVLTRPREPEATPHEALLAEDLQTLAYVPIVLGDQVLGMLACGVRNPSFFMSEDFLALLQAIANGLAISLSAAQHRQKEAMLKAQYEATLANLSDAVRVTDSTERTIYVNDAYVSLVQGPSRSFFMQKEFPEIYKGLDLRVGEKAIPIEEAPTMRALRTREVQNLAAVRMRTMQGQERILNISSVPVLDVNRKVVQVVTLYRDITELYRLKEALEQRVADRTRELATERDRLKVAVDDLQNLEKLKAAFINAVSHDLRIPLTGIVGYAEFIEDEIGGPISEEHRQFAHSIIDASRRMTALLNELLDFARMEAGRFAVEPRRVAFAPLLQEAVATFKPLLEKKHLKLAREVPADLPEVLADPARVIQVLSNLLSNAIKFTPEGGRITVRAFPETSRLRVEVSDTGVGIPREALPHMFERFYQTKAGVQAGGTGLGLSIAKALIEAQGGQIGVFSQEGEGATFWFTLPFPPAEPEESI